jgi:hypothetical protein
MLSISPTALRLVTLASLLGATACGDTLSGPKLDNDPNNPTAVTVGALLSSVQTALWSQMESQLPRTACVWMQQCSAQTNNLQLGTYGIGDGSTWVYAWQQTYGVGGLIDLRRLQRLTLARADSATAGVAAVMEAMLVGLAADVWGDIPYAKAVDSTVTAPPLDPQQDVYAHVQAKLDTAIAWLAATGPTNVGPGTAEPVYGGDKDKWTRLAHTLKARFHLHTAEVLGDPAYAAALAEGQLGLQDGEDYTSHHTTVITESNAWYQYTTTQAPDYMAAGKYLVDLLQATGDPLLPVYFASNGSGTYQGAGPGEALDPGTVSGFGAARVDPAFAQPVVAAVENRLILAEAEYRTNPAQGLATLEAVRAARGLAPLSPAPTGAAILQAIITEKYIQLFQTPEVWNDYKRTCYPALVPWSGATAIPGRIVYPLDERNANSSIPGPGPARNWNDPNGC